MVPKNLYRNTLMSCRRQEYTKVTFLFLVSTTTPPPVAYSTACIGGSKISHNVYVCVCVCVGGGDTTTTNEILIGRDGSGGGCVVQRFHIGLAPKSLTGLAELRFLSYIITTPYHFFCQSKNCA